MREAVENVKVPKLWFKATGNDGVLTGYSLALTSFIKGTGGFPGAPSSRTRSADADFRTQCTESLSIKLAVHIEGSYDFRRGVPTKLRAM